MLPKSQRISRKEYPNLQFKGKTLVSSHFMLKVMPADRAKFAVSVSKKVAKAATLRNRTRRRVYSLLRDIVSTVRPALYLIIAKPGADRLKSGEIRNEINKLI